MLVVCIFSHHINKGQLIHITTRKKVEGLEINVIYWFEKTQITHKTQIRVCQCFRSLILITTDQN